MIDPNVRAQLEAMRDRLLAQAGLTDDDVRDDEQLWHDLIDGQSNTLDVLRDVVRQALNAEMLAEALMQRTRTMTARKARLERRGEVARDAVKECLGILGLTKLEADDFTASVHTGQPPLIFNDKDIDRLPPEYLRIKKEADRVKLRQALKDGQTIDVATLGNAAPVLAIKQN